MRLVTASGTKVVHDVGLLQFYPLTELGILQKNATTSSFANYSCQEIVNTFGCINKAPHSKLVLHKIVMISNLVNDSCQEDITISRFPQDDIQEMTMTFGFPTHTLQGK